MRNQILSKSTLVAPSLALAVFSTQASAASIGDLAGGQWTTELQSLFLFGGIAFAFVGFILVGICLYGIASIKVFPNAPGSQRFESAGVGGLFAGALASAGLIVLSSLVAYFFGSVAGDSADTDAFDRLKSSSIQYQKAPSTTVAEIDLTALEAKV